ncbi:hypothetical protein [Parasitella parasitica]|uniref:Uncharacterized protein n=1 Tax=Parasitella parasitica TaxID=35722 RepID=A0A0B7NG74_9FUNG|nr:hypothetical protein [Parasitella parasitica]
MWQFAFLLQFVVEPNISIGNAHSLKYFSSDAEALALGKAKENWVDNVDAEFPSLASVIAGADPGAGTASVDVKIDT